MHGPQTYTVGSCFSGPGWLMGLLQATLASFPAVAELVSWTVPGHDLLIFLSLLTELAAATNLAILRYSEIVWIYPGQIVIVQCIYLM